MSRARRGSVRGAFTRTFNELKEEIEKGENADPVMLKRGLRRLEDRFSQLDKLDEIIMQEMVDSNANQDDMDEENDTRQEYRDKMNDITSMVEEICKPDEGEKTGNNSTCGGSSCTGDGKSRYKLPKLELVKFEGEPKDWLNFWSQFKGIHEDEKLSSEEKFQYLIQATVVDSPARRVVASFPPTAENYQKAVDHLKNRFGKDKILVEVYVRELLQLVTDPNSRHESLSTLYDTLATKLRALESLGVTSDKYASMLYPLVESTLSYEVLKTWERIRLGSESIGNECEDQLNHLMKFLQAEVESETRLKMAKRGIEENELDGSRKRQRLMFLEPTTATDLVNKTEILKEKCIFCERAHKSQHCITARNMPTSEKNSKIFNARRCFRCFQPNHIKKNCRSSIQCQTCKKTSHCTIMCVQNRLGESNLSAVAISYRFGTTILQTLLIKVDGPNGQHVMRAIIDTGSHHSYINKRAAIILGLIKQTVINTSHSLFGGLVTRQVNHIVYKAGISNLAGSHKEQVYLLDQEKICGSIPPIRDGPWINELKRSGIELTDFNSGREEIDILLGADIASTLATGNIYRTKGGPVAFETSLGWTLMGKTNVDKKQVDETLVLHSLYINDASIQDLWRLDLIGIHDSTDNQTREQATESALTQFNESLRRDPDGRYEVALPWKEGHQPVAENRELALHRLDSCLKKLQIHDKVKEYNDVFLQWCQLGIIEEVKLTEYDVKQSSYLPHHPVFNPKSSTTPIRPVFDASAKSKGKPSLNSCLEKGPNLLEIIMFLLLQFRMEQYGVIADIEKAFLQIGVRKADRDFLRFLWRVNGKTIIYRHCRVVFGVTSSPFLLAATLNKHLDNAHPDFKETAQLLKKSIYVDNCVVSVPTTTELKKFINEATVLCQQAKFNLRGWVWNRGKAFNGDTPGVGSPECGLGVGINVFQETSVVSVLGLLWNAMEDTLSLDLHKVLNSTSDAVTKRSILSATHRIFDPLGFASPVTIVPKMILQKLFKRKLKWDEPVPDEIAKSFRSWSEGITLLKDMKIPRWVKVANVVDQSIHVFTDASQNAYAAVAFLRTVTEETVNIQLLASKARVSTIKPITIPRLELIACECGAKLGEYLKNSINVSNAKWYFWSDSSNALSWIKRNENWMIFVNNRVMKIRSLTNADDWHHVPGNLNPADLPSRGCSAKQLLQSRWWEGPEWLKDSEDHWPKSELNCDEEVVSAEKRVTISSYIIQDLITPRYFMYFSKLRKIIRMLAWMLRWRHFKRNQNNRTKDLTMEEENNAERCLWRMVQSEVFNSTDKVINQINAVKDEYGLWRVKTKLFMRQDSEGFRMPILLPKQHIAVDRLIQQEHLRMNHCGVQVLRSEIRERFWILQGRKVIRHQKNACKRCKRFEQKKCETPAVPLPLNRVRDATAFEVVGIDLGGPLYLENDCKSWFVPFTCAVYRAIHLELVTSLSSMEFIQALRRFIARRTRPSVIYSDNGLNFTGTENLLAQLNWDEILSSSTAQRIKWIFNPPSAPWWGGWWERIIGMVKQLLRRILGKALVSYEEMVTILCDCEWTINSRPITYMNDDIEELIPLTPMMFLNEKRSCEVPDLDQIEGTSLVERYRYRQILRQQLRERFRQEYLSTLVHRNKKQGEMTILRIGDVVLVETENKKRVDWPIARIIDVYPGIDGVIRSVQLKIVKGSRISTLVRPTKRLYLLETSSKELQETFGMNSENIAIEAKTVGLQKEPMTSNDKQVDNEKEQTESKSIMASKTSNMEERVKFTRSGRMIKVPNRLQC